MTDRSDAGGGGLTGATGDLTPDDSDQAFVPGERREIEDGGSRAGVAGPESGEGDAATDDEERF